MKEKILFIGIGFYDYEKAIKEEFELLGYEVDYFSEVLPLNLKNKFFNKDSSKKNAAYLDDKVNTAGNEYKIIFVIKCEFLSVDNLELLKVKNPNAKFILYLWDSIKRINNIEEKIHFFDKVFSFDRMDCIADERLAFLPLFYRNEYQNNNQSDNLIHGVYHLGWLHSDRFELLKKIKKQLDNKNVNNYFLLYTGFFNYLRIIILKKQFQYRNILIYKPLKVSENIKNILQYTISLDITHPNQTGLTMRTIELIGLRKKFITTNKDIVNYDFYHENNILIIDREQPIINEQFFKSDYENIAQDIIKSYSINSWVRNILNIN